MESADEIILKKKTTEKSTAVVITDYSVYLGYLGRYRDKSSNNQFANI